MVQNIIFPQWEALTKSNFSYNFIYINYLELINNSIIYLILYILDLFNLNNRRIIGLFNKKRLRLSYIPHPYFSILTTSDKSLAIKKLYHFIYTSCMTWQGLNFLKLFISNI